MSEEEVSNILISIFKKVLDLDVGEPGSRKETMSWDSLKHINLIMNIEKTFQISFEFYEVLDMTNFENIKKMVWKKVADRMT